MMFPMLAQHDGRPRATDGSSRAGVTLVETVTAAGVLAVVALALALSMSTSIIVARSSGTRFIAQQAAARVVERARALPFDQAWRELWAGRGVEVQDGRVVEDLAGILRAVRAEVLAPALAEGRIGQGARPMLTLRLLGEGEHNDLWRCAVDLDLDGSTRGLLPAPGVDVPAPAYAFYPVLVEVAWRDDAGDHVHSLPAVISNEPQLDPARE
jgi:hypothetical protein